MFIFSFARCERPFMETAVSGGQQFSVWVQGLSRYLSYALLDKTVTKPVLLIKHGWREMLAFGVLFHRCVGTSSLKGREDERFSENRSEREKYSPSLKYSTIGSESFKK